MWAVTFATRLNLMFLFLLLYLYLHYTIVTLRIDVKQLTNVCLATPVFNQRF